MALIYAIPGFACTEKLFERLELPGHQLVVLKWPEPKQDYTLKQYAAQFISQIDQNHQFYLMGVSFGGMICSEISEMVRAERTILISSARNRTELPWPVRFLKYLPLHLLFREKTLRWMAAHSGWILGIEKDLMPAFVSMMNSMHKSYFRNCCRYIINWNKKSGTSGIYHIHGKRDRLLWFSGVKQVDKVIENGGHAMVVYQAPEISHALTKILDNGSLSRSK